MEEHWKRYFQVFGLPIISESSAGLTSCAWKSFRNFSKCNSLHYPSCELLTNNCWSSSKIQAGNLRAMFESIHVAVGYYISLNCWWKSKLTELVAAVISDHGIIKSNIKLNYFKLVTASSLTFPYFSHQRLKENKNLVSEWVKYWL